MTMLICAFAMGVVAGLRTMTAPAAVSWAARLGALPVGDTGLAVLGYAWTPWILTLLALGEYVADQWPSTPSRTVPVQFAGRVLSGAFCGAAIGAASASMAAGAAAGAVGAVVGTLGGRAARGRLASAFGRDRPAAFIEDGVAVGAAALIVGALA
ncbi:DUF4126 domain-containing protein [Alsobacter sp. KACC 23698]|uniref:DUF4126 domain-containing protein n=1 Tax=Alsobacter sp. KACC 23698 TaxID=3149229 RepID=A0AAU7JM24_9HYPH